MDASKDNQVVSGATVRIGLGEMSSFIEVTTNDAGKAEFDVSTNIRKLSLQIVDAPESVKEPMFELHDDFEFLKDAEVDITILERMVSFKNKASVFNVGQFHYSFFLSF